ncbi:metallophosphoesterase family protein [Benzoatithermus flavus]|uniref:Metallophosphoesterase family protein n=1 Tax=Benzoatithermus flavus TaxID=3108223 RepID=A0ABU8XR28_9PROT
MLKRLFQRSRASLPSEPTIAGRPPAVPRGLRAYVVGDIHGRHDLLQMMERMIVDDVRETGRHLDCIVVHLGDYVDRGFESSKVVEHLLQVPADGLPRVHLLGNHDLWLREFLNASDQSPEAAASWLRFGGDATLLSYGVKLDLKKPEPERFVDARLQLENRLPPEHEAFLAELELAFSLGDYFFCHAGIRPDLPLERQSEAELLWIREPFLSWTGDCGKIIVHGHTVEETPVVRSNRIGIDTGACWTGRLTCLVLEGTGRRFLHTGR